MFLKVDKILFFTIIVLLCFGLVIFGSASLGVLSVNEVKFFSVIKNQLVFALIGGGFALFVGSQIPYHFYKKYSYYLFFGALFVTSLVFIPQLSAYHGGAHRWIDLGSISLQPSEALKIGFVLVTAMWCSTYRSHFKDWKYGLLPYAIATAMVTVVMLAQPDFGTFLVIMVSSFSVFFIGGARKKHIMLLMAIGLVGAVTLIAVRPYMLERVKTLFNSSNDPRGSSWQLNQSLIAIGGGGVFGRGLGQSVQKFNYLPEPIGDSIFAVASEELGLIGVIIIVSIYGILGIRGYIISLRAEDQFGRLLGVGIITIILSQATLNIGSMLGLLPLTGVPLPLVSHGGTALMVTLFELGILLNISKNQNL